MTTHNTGTILHQPKIYDSYPKPAVPINPEIPIPPNEPKEWSEVSDINTIEAQKQGHDGNVDNKSTYTVMDSTQYSIDKYAEQMKNIKKTDGLAIYQEFT